MTIESESRFNISQSELCLIFDVCVYDTPFRGKPITFIRRKLVAIREAVSNHTRSTTLSKSMKLSHVRGATQDGRVMVERSDRMWSTGEGNGKPLQYSCLENPITV